MNKPVLREINCLLCYAGEGGLSNADGSFPTKYRISIFHINYSDTESD